MSDTQQGPEWWQASDGKWYPPPRPDWPAPTEAEPVVPVASPPSSATPPEPTTPPTAPTEVAAEPAAVPSTPPEPTAPPTEAVAAPEPMSPVVPMAPPDATEVAPPVEPAPGATQPAFPDPTTAGVPPTSLETAAFPPGPPGVGPSPSGDPFGTPDKNKTPLIVGGVIAAVIALVLAFVVFGSGDDDDPVSAGDTTSTSTNAPEDKEGEPDPVPPPDSGFPEFVDPADADPMEVDETGFVLVPDEFDDGVTNASYGLVITNPNTGLAATSVEVTIGLFDDAGTAVETETSFVSGLLGGQSVGLGDFLRDVPGNIVRIDVTAEASQLVRTGDLGGELTVSDTAITQEEFGGITVTSKVSSTFEERQENLPLYGVFRNEAGGLVGGTQSILAFVEGGGTSTAELRSFANIPGITSADVSVTLSAENFFD